MAEVKVMFKMEVFVSARMSVSPTIYQLKSRRFVQGKTALICYGFSSNDK